MTLAPNTVEVSGTDKTIDVTATFTKHEISTDPDVGNLVVVVNTSCASYITINSVTGITVDNATATAVLNITVKGDAPSTQCSISATYGSDVIDPPVTCEASFTITQTPLVSSTTTVEPATTTTVPPDACLVTFAPNTVEVSGTDKTVDVTATFKKHEISTDPDVGNLVVVVNTSCASYITINSVTGIIVDNATATAVLNITVKGDAPSTQCTINASYGSDVIDPPVTCEASFTITQTAQQGCLVASVEPALLPLYAGYLFPRIRGIVITGQNSNWDRTSAVSIEGIRIIVPGRIDPTVIHATITIPGIWFGFVPGEKAVSVATGAEVCKGKVTIPAIF